MVIIRATVAKVMQNNLERMPAAWVIGREGERQEGGESSGERGDSLSFSIFQRWKTYGCYVTAALGSFLTNALKITETENPF